MEIRYENITSYVNKFFGNNAKADECLAILNQNPAIWSNVHIPIVLEIVCSIYTITPGEKLAEINSLPKLYKIMVDNLWQRYMKKSQMTNQRHVSNKEVIMLNNALSMLSALGFSNNEINLSLGTLKKVHRDGNNSNIDFIQWCNLLEQSGFVRPIVNSGTQDAQYYFIHLSFQEYFAGLYYAQEFINKSTEVKVYFRDTQYSKPHRLICNM